MTSKLKTDVLETVSGTGTIALTNQLSGMTAASLPTLTSAEMPAGSIVQVVGFSSNAATTTTSTSYAVTHLTQNITPKFANSKLLIVVNFNTHFGASGHGQGQIRKDGYVAANYANDDLLAYFGDTTSRGDMTCQQLVIDAGSTATATYAYYIKVTTTSLFYCYRNSSITITEIKQ